MALVVTLLRFSLALLLFFAAPLSAEGNGGLRTTDVKRVMEQIFNKHLQNKEITAEIVKKSFHIYIDQFDPDRIYLLESEVSPFVDLNRADTRKILKQYQRNDFSAYEKLNSVIQRAIARHRDYRNALIQQKMKTISKEALKDTSSQPSYYTHFAKNISELKLRQMNRLQEYLERERSRYSAATFSNWESKILKEYDQTMRESEAPYLYVDESGKPLLANERENLFVMHVIKALAKSLDAHTSFYNESEAYDMRVRLEKGFDGIGIVLTKEFSGYRIVKILPNSPAEKNRQLKVGDYLQRINGKSIDEEPLSSVMKMLRGQKGSLVSLQLRHEGNNEGEGVSHYSVLLKREPIIIDEGRVEVSSVNFGNGVIGTIKLLSFYQGNNGISSEEDVRKAIEKLQKSGKLSGLVLDLRENSGGFLTQAVKVAGLFITNGVIVVSKYSSGEQRFYRDMDGKVSYQGPLIVLTSRATASAAEIVAQALQDYGVALVVGDEHTYGKGTIQSQTVTDEEGGGGSYFKVTVGKYYTVSGKTPQIEGVKADVVVPSPYSLEQIGEEYLEYPLSKDTIPDSFQDTLSDIDPGLRPWYLRYYMPTLQKRTAMWRDFIPLLQHNSQNRLSQSKGYSNFLKNGQFDDEHSYNDDEIAELDNKRDQQLFEAVNIVKDMILLESKAHQGSRIGVTDVYLLPD